jgi:hypothetical protein
MERLARHPMLDRPTRASGGVLGGSSLVPAALYAVVTGLLAGWAASQKSFGKEVIGLLLLLLAVLALSVPPTVFVALALLVIGTDSLSEAHPLRFGGAQVYSLDILLGIVLLRALLPRERTRAPAALRDMTRLLFAIWALVMVAAALRAALDGYRTVSIIRLSTPLLYSVGFYFGLGRIIRERGFDLGKAVRNLLVVALGLVAYMVFARVTNAPFENETNPSVGHLALVTTTAGVLRRDYGFATSFIVYPVLGLAGAAYLLHAPRRTAVAAVVAGIGILTTLLTLIRGEIFGLGFGLALIAFLRAPTEARANRATVVVAGTFVVLVGGLGFWIASPSTARGVAERSLPGLVQQTTKADATAQYRKDAIRAGLAAADRHPAGVGFVPDESLTAKSGVDLGFVAHSGLTATAVYTGWLGLIASALALVSLLRSSFAMPHPVRWLHPFFVGSLLMLIFYTVFDASGLFGQGWVTTLAALIAALRFQSGNSLG